MKNAATTAFSPLHFHTSTQVSAPEPTLSCWEAHWLCCSRAVLGGEPPAYALGPVAQPWHYVQPWTTMENEALAAMGAHRTIWTPLEGTVNSFWFSGNINDKLSTPAIGFYQLILVTFSKLCSKEKGQEI